MKYMLLVLALASGFHSTAFAQKNFEGKVSYGIEYSNVPAEMAPYQSMLPKEVNVYLKGQQSRIEQQGPMGSQTVVLADHKEKTGDLLTNAMGKKVHIHITKEEVEKEEENEEDYEVKYFDETKEIAGYTCKKAEAITEDGSFTIFYTEEISGDLSNQYKKIKGFPLEYEVNEGEMTVTFLAKEVTKKKLEKALFEVPDGYETMTMDEFRESLGGM